MEQPLLTVQHRLFQELGLSSALALPPLLPLLWCSEPLPLESVRAVARASTLCVRLTGSVPELREGEIVLPVEPARRRGEKASTAPLERLRNAAKKEREKKQMEGQVERGETLFPIFNAIRLATAETRSPANRPESEGFPPNLHELTFEPIGGESEAVTVVSFRILFGQKEPWWSRLFFEAVAYRRVTVRS